MAQKKVTVSPIAPGVRSKATEPEPRRPKREEKVVEAVRLGRKAHEGAGPGDAASIQFPVSLYIRVSTDRQAKKGDSLEEQESELKKFCDYRNFQIRKIFIERGKFGGNTNRPEYQKLVKDIKSGKIKAIVVKKLDRLSRSLLDFEALMLKMQENNVEFMSLRENFDTTMAMGKAMLRVALVFAQLKREQTAERIKDVIAYRASQGLSMSDWFSFMTRSSKELINP